MKSGYVKIIDTAAIKGRGATSKFLDAKDYHKLYPGKAIRSKDYIFEPGMPKELPEKEAYALMVKYKTLRVVGKDSTDILPIQDDLENMTWEELIETGVRYRVNLLRIGREKLKTEIRKKRKEGVIPLTDNEYNAYMKNKEEIKKYKLYIFGVLKKEKKRIGRELHEEEIKIFEEIKREIKECDIIEWDVIKPNIEKRLKNLIAKIRSDDEQLDAK